ncbi:GAF and ANTAR domain-containing protein [Curtobacterium sp. MCLR17_058]|uniref:GAF and ANTAR domain-containing protein n=1 Tax=Curtobacterium sp. MCLR17_058 TaxID=2175635 RepID=UPI000DA961EF|nr:GAF and ANTAR domain-containing protein [Curtobacterium sp. MCLR17_058]WIB42705.1 GAF and ANTAR domain-containing protein [Curtobacterium sp. MCLR17_058]
MSRSSDAIHRAGDGDEDDDLAGPFVTVLPIAAAVVSTLGGIFGSAVVDASDPSAAAADEEQVTLGEGPGWSALRHRSAVTVYDLATATAEEWPTALTMLRQTDWSGLLSFPLFVGSLDIGAVTLYMSGAGPFSSAQMSDATCLAGHTAQRILAGAVRDMAAGSTPAVSSVMQPSGRRIHQATGMVSAQFGVAVEDALLVIRARAFADDQPLPTLAEAILERRLDLRHDPGNQ